MPNQATPAAPLCPIPVMGQLFEKINVDCIGPLPKTKAGNQCLLTVMCASTRFPEAMPLRKITAPVETKALVKFFKGTNFKSKVSGHVLKTSGIVHITSSPYHPESQGALGSFTRLWNLCCANTAMSLRGIGKMDSHLFCLLLMRLYRNRYGWFHQGNWRESLGFSPVFGHEVWGPLKVLKEHLVTPEKRTLSIREYVTKVKDHLQLACSLTREALSSSSSQVKMKKQYRELPGLSSQVSSLFWRCKWWWWWWVSYA